MVSVLAELEQQIVRLLAPTGSLHPADPRNVLLTLERGYFEGVAELERAGYGASGLSVYEFWLKLGKLEEKRGQ